MIIRRYTPPTCTLEVAAKRPWLSRLKKQPILEQFKFKLCLDDPRLPESDHVMIEGDRTQLEILCQVLQTYIQNFLSFSQNIHAKVEPPSLQSSTHNTPGFLLFDEKEAEIKIKPDGLLYHDLFLGTLTSNQPDLFVHLSVLQLFDLATALAEYRAEAEDLPYLKSVEKTTPQWLKTALLIIISTGCLTGIIRLINLYRQPQTETATQPAASIPIPPPNLVSPTPPALAPLPVPSATPPAPVQVAPNLPLVNTAPLPVPPPLFPPFTTPPVMEPLPQPAPESGGFIVIPEDNNSPQAAPPPAVPPAPPPLAGSQPPPLPAAPPVIFAPETIELPRLKNADPPIAINVPSPANNPAENSNPDSSNYLAQLNKRPPSIAATRPQNPTLFDQIPQVAEVRNYFQKIWYPPKNLSRTLQYSLNINSDGSLQSIIPIGQPAINRQQQVVFPKIGQPFVTAIAEGKAAKIRVVFNPDGSVQAFLESLS